MCLVDITGQVFRPNEDVDISGDQRHYHLAWITPGEFLRYTVNVERAGEDMKSKLRVWYVPRALVQKHAKLFLEQQAPLCSLALCLFVCVAAAENINGMPSSSANILVSL